MNTRWTTPHLKPHRPGTDFENLFHDCFHTICPKMIKAEKRMDLHQGTDFITNKIHIDTTLDFSNKDNMPFLFDTKIPAFGDQNFKIGIRIGNNHSGYTEFKKPVIVFGIDCDPYTYTLNQHIIEYNLLTHLSDLRDHIFDAYEDYMTLDPAERENLFATPLRPNLAYRQPKSISKRALRRNTFQYDIMESKDDEPEFT